MKKIVINYVFIFLFCRKESEFVEYHYHGIKTNSRGFIGQNETFCPHCGIYISYAHAKAHYCEKKNSENMCEICARPFVEESLFLQLAPNVQVNFCVKKISNIKDTKSITCHFCKRSAQNSLCYQLHKRYKCHNVSVCKKCTRNFKLTGKYSRVVRKKIPEEHDNCEEVYCYNCNDYVLGFDNPRNPTHTCYVKPIRMAKQWPALIVAFDFETFPYDKDGTMRVNMAHMITQKNPAEPNSEFVGVFFTDIPMEGVVLNGQNVKPGEEYTPDLDPNLTDYYPFDILKSEAMAGKTAPAENEKVTEKEVKK